MLEVTVKTLDSQSRNFSVPDDITVQGFKENISSAVNIPVERQRLIYQGRVLQDSAQLNSSGDINGKVIHLVERLPAPVQPTPAQQAGQQQPQSQPNQPGAGPRAPTPANPANVIRSFPMQGPGGNLNSGQFVQQMIQQALSGMASPMGPTVVRGSVRHPNAPGGDSRTEIQIEINPQGSSRAAGNVQARQAAQPNVTQQQGAAAHAPRPAQPQAVPSAPRREVHSIECLLDKLEEHVKNLEAAKARGDDDDDDEPSTSSGTAAANKPKKTPGDDNEATSTCSGAAAASKSENRSTSTEPMEVQTQPPTSQPEGASGSSAANKPPGGETASRSESESPTGHPSFPFVGRLMRRLTDLEARSLQFQTDFADFMERDPPFSSTRTPEFRGWQTFLTEVLKIQQTLSMIHRAMASLVIPLSETPPRHVLVQAGPRHGAHSGPTHRIHNVVSAGPHPDQPGPRHSGPHRHYHGPHQHGSHIIRGPHHQVGVPILVGPIGPGVPSGVRPSVIQMPMFGFSPASPRPVRPHVSGLYGHPPPQQQTSSTSPARSTAVRALPAPMASTGAAASGGSTAPASVTVSTTTASASTAASQQNASSAPSSGSTRVDFMPPEYTIQVTTHVQPNININIVPSSLGGAAASSPANIAVVEEFEETTVTGSEMDVDAPDGQMNATAMDDGENIPPVEVIFPNIPGISQDGMRQIIDSVQNSIQQIANSSTMQSGRISVTGFPGGQDQVPTDIANIIGQTVQDVMLNHMHGASQQQPQDSTDQPATASTASQPTSVPTDASPVVTSATASTPTVTTAATSTSVPTTTQSESNPPGSQNMLAGLLAQISTGAFGTRAGSASAPDSSPAEPVRKVEGHAGRNRRRLPAIRRTENCVNDIVRGQGYPREMMELTGQENMMSLLLFLSGELLTIPDCMSFMSGASEPANRMRGPLRDALVECWFDGKIPNRDDIEAAVEQESEAARPMIEKCFEGAIPKSPDISVVESNLSFYRFVLRKVLHLLFINDSEQFARDLLRHMMDCFALVLQLNINILRGTEEAVVQLVMAQLGGALDAFTVGAPSGGSDPMAEQMRALIGSQMLPFIRRRPVSQDQIDQFVMNVPRPAEPEMEVATEPLEEAEKVPPTEQTTTDPPQLPQVESDTVVVIDDSPGDADEAEMKGEEPEGAVGEDRDWRSMVPDEWIPVISSDIEKQKELPEQPPYSEAYLAGMPANKRRKV